MKMEKAKRWLAGVLVVVLVMGVLPVEAMAEVLDNTAGEVCECTEACTAESRNEACPVCGEEGADLTLCAGGKTLAEAPEETPEETPETASGETPAETPEGTSGETPETPEDPEVPENLGAPEELEIPEGLLRRLRIGRDGVHDPAAGDKRADAHRGSGQEGRRRHVHDVRHSA